MTRTWWGEFPLPEGDRRLWQIGPLRFWATRLAEEWQLITESTEDGPGSEAAAAAEATEQPGPAASTARFGFRASPKAIRLLPAAADRPVVVKATSPFFVPPGEEISLFVSTPLWLQVGTTGSSDVLHEIPLERPSDTWFGPSTREGELCYAARTSVRYNLENVVRRPHRAISVVRIRNRAGAQLALERLKLPLPFLSIYGSEEGQLWTESVTLEREVEDGNASVKLGRGAPRAAGAVKRVTGPRRHVDKGLLTRTFGSLFGLKGAGDYERVGE